MLVLLDELPNLLIKFFAAEIEAAFPLFLQLFFINYPSFKTRMVGTGHEKRRLPFQPLITHDGILDGDSQPEADMQVGVGVRRRHDDAEVVIATPVFW